MDAPKSNPLVPAAPSPATPVPPLSPDKSAPLKLEDIKKAPKEGAKSPELQKDKKNEPDDRLRWFFRAKISGVAGAKSDAAIAPAAPAKDTKDATLKLNKGPKGEPLKLDQIKKPTKEGIIPTPTTFKSEADSPLGFVGTELEKLNKLGDKKATTNFVEDTLAKLLSPDNPETKTPETGELLIDSTKGDILGEPFIRLSTYQVSTAKFIINDPDDSIRKQLLKHSKIEIEAGFVNGFKLNKFVGVIFAIGRKFPDGTVVEAVDTSQKMATGAPPIQVAGAVQQPLADEKTKELVTSTFEGEAVFMGGGKGMTASHATLPLTSRVRITNTANNKTTIVTINDKSIGPGGWVLELSKDAAKALGLEQTGAIKIKAEVLETEAEKKAREAKNPKPKDAITPTTTSEKSATDVPTADGAATDTTTTPDVKKSDRKPLAPSATAETEKQQQKPVQEKLAIPTTNTASANFQAEMAKISDRSPREQNLNAKLFTNATDLKINDKSLFKLTGAGNIAVSQTMLEAAQKDAALKGQTVIARGNTVTQAAPGGGSPSGVVLDYQANRAAFIKVFVNRRMGVQLKSGYGAITVKGFNVNDKTVVSATAVSTQPPKQHPTGVIQAPEWGTIKLSEPIIPGSPYTWATATRNGERVPTKDVMGKIIQICQVITPLTAKTVGAGKSWGITSWYRDPATNAATPGAAAQSEHMTGGAVDFYYDTNGGEMALFRELEGSYEGGLAVKHGGFVHIDVGPRGRWNY
jgi:hypothetical protein